MKWELRSIGYWSLIKISFVVNLIVGFVFGIFVALFIGAFYSLLEKFSGFSDMGMSYDELPPVGFLIVFYPFFLSFMAAFFNTLLALIIAFVYNIVVKMIGGIEFEFRELRLEPPAYTGYPHPAQPVSYPAYPSTGSPYTTAAPPPPPPPVQSFPSPSKEPRTETDSDKQQL